MSWPSKNDCNAYNGSGQAAHISPSSRLHVIAAFASMRPGAPLFGDFGPCGFGREISQDNAPDLEHLKASCWESNKQLIASLHEDERSKELLEITRTDAALGRMTPTVDTCLLDQTKVGASLPVLARTFRVSSCLGTSVSPRAPLRS